MKRAVVPFGAGAVRLRLLERADLPDTLTWRNRDEARIWFKTSSPVSPQSHELWFEAYLGKPDDLHFIIEAEGRRAGQAAVYRIDAATASAELGRFLIAPEAAGRGIMRQAVPCLVDFCRDMLALRLLYLEVFDTNRRSIALSRHCGFEVESRTADLLRMTRTL